MTTHPTSRQTLLVTGGAGFIGANFVLNWLGNADADSVVNVDKLTYAGNLANLAPVWENPRFRFVQADIGDDVFGAVSSSPRIVNSARMLLRELAPDVTNRTMLHPSSMYRLFAPFWWGHVGPEWVHRHARYRRIEPPAMRPFGGSSPSTELLSVDLPPGA